MNMIPVFEKYKPRKIAFHDWLRINEWTVKVYTISMKDEYSSHKLLLSIERNLTKWLMDIEQSKLPTYQQAFLIVHEAREGVWILLSWWTGGEMIETKVYFSDNTEPFNITDSPYNKNALLCVWELEIFAHERKTWIKHILENADKPCFENYRIDVLNSA